VFSRNEEITFTARLEKNGKPVSKGELQWTLSKDGLGSLSTGSTPIEGGVAHIKGSLAEPGFLQCLAVYTTPDDAAKVIQRGAVAIEPLKIDPSLPSPADFDTFWNAQKEALTKIKADPILTEISSPIPEVTCFDVQAGAIDAPVSAYLARPANAKPRSLPAILLVHGAGVRSSSLGAATYWAKNGALAMDLNAHGIANGQPPEFYTELQNGALRDYRTRGGDDREHVYFRGMFLRLIRAIDLLTAQPEWDGRTVVVYGSSQGGAQALVAAGLDSRVTFFAAGVPAMCDHTGMIRERICGWPKFVPLNADHQPDARALDSIRYYDAVNFATRIKVPGIVTVGFIDTTCPPTTVYAAYNAIPGTKDIFNDPLSDHHVSSAASDAMEKAVRAHISASTRKAHAGN